jgi:cation:H+ antiporter
MVFGLGLGASIALGLVAVIAVVYGAEIAVDKLTALAAYFGIPDVLIAMSVVSIGTSLPEIISHIVASIGILNGNLSYEIASATVLGANTGSDIIQQTLIVGIVIFSFAFIGEKSYFRFTDEFLKKDFLPIIGTSLMAWYVSWDGIVSRLDGIVLIGSFIAYMYYLFRTRHDRLNEKSDPSDNVRKDILVAVIALATVLASAHIVLEVTELLVQATGLGGSIIGVVTLGIISALPELFTAIEGIRQKASGISLGTLIGSNVTNPLLGYGIGGLLSTYWVPRPLVLIDLPTETVTALIMLLWVLFVSDRKLGWKGGILLIFTYIAYVIVRFSFFAAD